MYQTKKEFSFKNPSFVRVSNSFDWIAFESTLATLSAIEYPRASHFPPTQELADDMAKASYPSAVELSFVSAHDDALFCCLTSSNLYITKKNLQ